MCWDACGYVASGLVLAAFAMKDMVPLRLVALLSNLAFIAYGLALDLTPIWLLHALLLPLNGCRLAEAVRGRRGLAGGTAFAQLAAMPASRAQGRRAGRAPVQHPPGRTAISRSLL